MKKTKIFDQLDNILGNWMEGRASEQDLILHAKKVNDYLIEHPHPHDIERTPKPVAADQPASVLADTPSPSGPLHTPYR